MSQFKNNQKLQELCWRDAYRTHKITVGFGGVTEIKVIMENGQNNEVPWVLISYDCGTFSKFNLAHVTSVELYNDDRIPRIFYTKIEDCDVTVRAARILSELGVVTWLDLMKFGLDNLLGQRNCGKKTVGELRYKIQKWQIDKAYENLLEDKEIDDE